MSEADLYGPIMIAVTALGHRLFRNNVGQYEYAPGKFIRYGVCNPGGGDLIGWMCDGRFLSVEVEKIGSRKTKKHREAQQRFRDAVNAAGGVGILVHSVEETVEALNERIPQR